ncbi:hypothetical protein ZOSMA_258G00210 [Zostera marina]|uniref:F-box domain-containing protein n=1 Tax=Zostera marina TaxID=29655 RepID=A0A0K9PFH3_ZOSMR|nr:hypothetical protein ZOSMA_258G00210 [Zostera marina]
MSSGGGCLRLLAMGISSGCEVATCLDGGINNMSGTGKEQNCPSHIHLPDDILELCLLRLPLSSLMTARLVCKKWSALTKTNHFRQIRSQPRYRNPWLFLVGASSCDAGTSAIHAFEVTMNRWRRVNCNDVLQRRILFSVAGVDTDLYIVGGRSSSSAGHSVRRKPVKTHKDVFVYCTLTGSWSKPASMNCARSSPVLGVFEFRSNHAVFNDTYSENQQTYRNSRRSLVYRASDVYGDPHHCSLRRNVTEDSSIITSDDETAKQNKKKKSSSIKRFAIIAVGGVGSWDEPLDSCEVYNPTANQWLTTGKLPANFGVVCSGVVLNNTFYVYSESDKLAGYNLKLGNWISIQIHANPPLLRLPGYSPRLVCCSGRIFLITASFLERGVEIVFRKVWELSSLSSSSCLLTEVGRHPDAPIDVDAEFFGDGDKIYGVEMFKIFGQKLDFLTAGDFSDKKEQPRWIRLSTNHAGCSSSYNAKKLVVLNI